MLVNTGSWLYEHGVRVAALGLGAIALCAAILTRSQRSASGSNATASRPETAARSFVQLLHRHGFDPSIALATYCYLDESESLASPINPEARLEQDLGLSPEQVEHTLLALMALLGRKPALDWRRPSIGTVEDLIGVLQASPAEERRSEQAAA